IGQALKIWARGPTRIPAAIVRVGIGNRVQGPCAAAVRPAKTQLKMVPHRSGTNGLRVSPITISSSRSGRVFCGWRCNVFRFIIMSPSNGNPDSL
ncbi:unnamed protein product, partial [Brassica rapa subsp. narinosa]